MNEKITLNNVMQLWASKYPEVTRWLTKLQKKERNALALYNFCKWANKTPQELLALKANDASVNPPPNEVEKLLDDFVASTAFTNVKTFQGSIAVKSFFKWNYRDLARACGAVTYENVKPYNKLAKDGLRKLWTFALNPRDRALISFVCSTAISKETLTNLKWSHLEENWENLELPCINVPSELLKGHGRGKYKGVRQITFLTPEAKRDLMNYKEWLERPQKLGRKLTPEDYMWLETGKPYERIGYGTFGMLIYTLSRNAGVPFSWHDARRWVNTALEQIGISLNWARKIRGRKVRGEESPYSQPAINQLRAKFREAVPLLEFTSEASGAFEDRLKAVEDFKASLSPEQREAAQKGGLRFAKRKPTPEKSEDCENGEHCQRVVGEAELASLLSEGWHASLVLPSGKIVVSR